MSIALLCPTRRRLKQHQRMVESYCVTSTTLNVWEYSATNGDGDFYVGNKFPTDTPTVFMWNKLAEKAMNMPIEKPHTLFMLCADDVIFSTPGWDVALLDHYNRLENKIHVYALQDSRDKDGTPHPIVTREWIDAMGYAFPPIFLHWYLDTWTVEIAKANNCFTHLRDFELIHDKPSDSGQADETHNRIRVMGWRERDKYVNDTCQHFLEFEKKRLAHIIADQKLDRKLVTE